jgi:hypothetical protein
LESSSGNAFAGQMQRGVNAGIRRRTRRKLNGDQWDLPNRRRTLVISPMQRHGVLLHVQSYSLRSHRSSADSDESYAKQALTSQISIAASQSECRIGRRELEYEVHLVRLHCICAKAAANQQPICKLKRRLKRRQPPSAASWCLGFTKAVYRGAALLHRNPQSEAVRVNLNVKAR